MNTTKFSTHFFACCVALLAPACWGQDAAASTKSESALIGVLTSDAPQSEKALACKSLAVHGSADAVPELAKLLSDPKLSSWARIALEAIPGEESDRALREAAASQKGRLLVGIINSIGVRRDAGAVKGLIKRLSGSDEEAAAAAAIALGRIGNGPATEALRGALASTSEDVQSAVAEGCVLCAERLHAAGDSELAANIYDQVRGIDLPKQRIIEATRGAILARNEQGADLLLETFRSDDKQMFQLALGTIREFPGDELDGVLVKELAGAAPARAALLVQAMSDRTETVDLGAILNAAQHGHKLVRLSAIDALRRIGNVSCLDSLLSLAADDDSELADAAKSTLAELPGQGVDEQIVSMLSKAEAAEQPALLRLIGQRRIHAFKQVTTALDSKDADVRKSALYALGETVDLERMSVLISQATAAPQSADTADALRALKVASIRMPDADKCTEKLVSAMRRAPESQGVLLEIIGDVGGGAALKTLAEAAKSSDAEKQDIASRLLGKWNNTDAGPVLLDLAKTAPAEKYQIRALRGYIGIARKFPMAERERVKMCQQAWDTAQRTAEKQLILDVLKIHPSRGGLNLANKALQDSELKEQAKATVQAIQRKVKR